MRNMLIRAVKGLALGHSPMIRWQDPGAEKTTLQHKPSKGNVTIRALLRVSQDKTFSGHQAPFCVLSPLSFGIALGNK